MILNIRGRHIRVHGDGKALRLMYERQYAELTNAQLDRFEKDDFPDRGIIREALEAVYKAEDLLRAKLLDEWDAAEDRLADGTSEFEYPDYINEEGEECLYAESVNEELDAAIHQLFEVGLTLREMLDES